MILTGSRPYYVDRRFEQATDDLDVFPFEVAQRPAPAAKFAKCASVEVAERVAERLGARMIADPASAIVGALRAVDDEPITAAPEPALEEARRFDPSTLRWDWEHRRQPGLYRVDLHGRPVHRLFDPYGRWPWLAIDLAAGQFLAVRDRRESVVRWRRATAERPAYFEVRKELSLPIIAERAATISSGLVPEVVDEWRRYLNVPRDLATRISSALLQDAPA